MRLFWSRTGVALLYLSVAAAAQEAGPPMKMQLEGRSVDETTVGSPSYNIQQFPGDLPTAPLVEVSNNTNGKPRAPREAPKTFRYIGRFRLQSF
jgi:hypothetical protein